MRGREDVKNERNERNETRGRGRLGLCCCVVVPILKTRNSE
jgi:hypothetical protein